MPISRAAIDVLALIPQEMQSPMRQLESAVEGVVTICCAIEPFVECLKREGYSVVLLPATLSSCDWWHIWAVVNTMESQPSILIYAMRSDFQTWCSILEAGGFDVIVAPFTPQKLCAAVEAAAQDFLTRSRP